jgi:hypothetical protein
LVVFTGSSPCYESPWLLVTPKKALLLHASVNTQKRPYVNT